MYNNAGKILKMLSLIWAIPLILILILIYPLKKFKIGMIQTQRVGGTVVQYAAAFYYHTIKPKDYKYIFFLEPAKPVNLYLINIIKRNLRIKPSFWWYVKFWVEKCFFFDFLIIRLDLISTSGNFYDVDFSFMLNENENFICENIMESYGLPKKSQFICLNIRDSVFLDESFKDIDFEYHSYRNGDLGKYIGSIKFLISNNYYVIRTGKQMLNSFDVILDKYIDYAGLPRTEMNDLIDIWLFTNCSGTISSGTGFDHLTILVKKPVLFVNCLPLAHFHSFANCLWAPKRLVHKGSGKELTLNEYIKSFYFQTEDYSNNNILVKHLDEFEILEITREFLKVSVGELNTAYNDSESLKSTEYFLSQLLDFKPARYFHTFIHPKARISHYWLNTISHDLNQIG
jgi:putative glycosyltransferase (TIGR04372 family)